MTICGCEDMFKKGIQLQVLLSSWMLWRDNGGVMKTELIFLTDPHMFTQNAVHVYSKRCCSVISLSEYLK